MYPPDPSYVPQIRLFLDGVGPISSRGLSTRETTAPDLHIQTGRAGVVCLGRVVTLQVAPQDTLACRVPDWLLCRMPWRSPGSRRAGAPALTAR